MRAWCGLNGRGRAWKAGKRRGLRPCRTIAWESFPGGRLTCGSRQDGAIELGARLRCCPLLPGRCSSSAGQPRAAPRVRTTSAVSTRCTRTLVSASFTTVTCRVVTSTPAEAGRRLPASQPASDRARPSAAARARGLPRTSTSSSPGDLDGRPGHGGQGGPPPRHSRCGRSGQLQGMPRGIFAVHHRFLPRTAAL